MGSLFEDGSLTVDSITRLTIALVLGFLVGLQREIDDQPAGLRTHLTVCLDDMRAALDELDDVDSRIVGAGKRDGWNEFRVEIEAEPGFSPEVCVEPLIHRDSVIDVRLVDESADL